MTRARSRTLLAAAIAAALLTTAGCATASPGAASSPGPGSSAGPVHVAGSGTVLEAGDVTRLCFSILESYPPQCGGGIAVRGWSWDGLEGVESAAGSTWGSYAVEGVLDGEVLTVTEPPVLLALFDPAPYTPSDDPLQRELDDRFGEGALRVLPTP